MYVVPENVATNNKTDICILQGGWSVPISGWHNYLSTYECIYIQV